MSKFDNIRPYYDSEVNQTLRDISTHPMVLSMLKFIFPQATKAFLGGVLHDCYSIQDFQAKVITRGVENVVSRSSEALTTSGFEKLSKDTAYLFVSNHRDIVLDTGLINLSLFQKGHAMTASAIGDNLVQKNFLLSLARLNRSFIVKRSLGPREMLSSSKLLSEYIYDSVSCQKRSVWLAQREGRTKNGDDKTQQGLLKMLTLGKPKEEEITTYLKKLKIVPVSISYEYDPTDMLKIPELKAKFYEEEYIKSENEDFDSILKGLSGYKKRIHIGVGDLIDCELDEVFSSDKLMNKSLQELACLIDEKIYGLYKLWPSNYIAYDRFYEVDKYADRYTEEEAKQFQRRFERRVNVEDQLAVRNFLLMYANPVVNKESLDAK